MRERVLRRALLASTAAVAVVAATAATASAGTLTLKPSIQGAGKLSGVVTCEQSPGVSGDAVLDCPPWQATNSTGQPMGATLTAEAAPGWKFDGWTNCTTPVDTTCKLAVPSDATQLSLTPRAKFIDVERATITFDPVVRWSNQERTVTILWTASEPGVTYKCTLDGAAAFACASPYVLSGTAGAHKFAVSATDASGNATKPLTLEVMLLDTGVTSGPAEGSFTNATTARFGFEGAPMGSIECSLDGAPYALCKSPYDLKALAEGKHTFEARVRNGDLVDLIPAKRTWTVDMTAPETSLWLEDDKPTFSFSSSEAGSTFKCSVDGAAFAPCTAPRAATGLAPGDHEFAVKAIDRAGNEDATPAKRRWTVEEPAPAATPTPTPEPVVTPAPVVVVAGPAKLTPGLSFRYVAGRKGTTFSRLALTGIPAGQRTAVKVSCPRGVKTCPKAFTVTGPASLTPLVGKRLAPGIKITAGTKTITIRRGRSPKVA